MMPPRATSVPRTRMTYSCESRPTSSRMRTGGMTMPSSDAIWRRIVADAREQRAAGALVDERHQAEADRQLERVERERVERGVARGGQLGLLAVGGRRPRALRAPALAVRLSLQRAASRRGRTPPMTRNGIFGRPGTRREDADHRRRRRAAPCAGRGSGRRRRCRGRSRRPERVTRMPVATEISSAGICAHRPSPTVSSEKWWRGLAEAACPAAATPITMPPSRLISDDQDAGHRVALDELRGTVHRAVEVGLVGDLRAALARLLVGDLAGVEVGVDRHLLAGHGVEGEARADLGDAAGAVRDRRRTGSRPGSGRSTRPTTTLPPTTKLPKALDHVAGVAVQQDQARDGDVDRQPEQRGQQQQARERRRSRARAARRASPRRSSAPPRCSA